MGNLHGGKKSRRASGTQVLRSVQKIVAKDNNCKTHISKNYDDAKERLKELVDDLRMDNMKQELIREFVRFAKLSRPGLAAVQGSYASGPMVKLDGVKKIVHNYLRALVEYSPLFWDTAFSMLIEDYEKRRADFEIMENNPDQDLSEMKRQKSQCESEIELLRNAKECVMQETKSRLSALCDRNESVVATGIYIEMDADKSGTVEKDEFFNNFNEKVIKIILGQLNYQKILPGSDEALEESSSSSEDESEGNPKTAVVTPPTKKDKKKKKKKNRKEKRKKKKLSQKGRDEMDGSMSMAYGEKW